MIQLIEEILVIMQLIMFFFGTPILIIFIICKREKEQRLEYEESTYSQLTRIPYQLIKRDSGRYGEYLIYKKLKHLECDGARFLFNAYIPKKNGHTTEIDIIMISRCGIFVFESKNYKGWIFGSVNSKKWCQCLKAGRYESQKEFFYNPIMQNSAHINAIKSFLNQYKITMHSIVVFSDKCDLMDTPGEKNNVIYLQNINRKITDIYSSNPDVLSEKQIEWIYKKLYPCTQVSEEIKEQHNQQIRNAKQ